MGSQYADLMLFSHWHDLLPCGQPPDGQQFEQWSWSHDGDWEWWKTVLGPTTDDAAQTWYPALPSAWHSTTWITDRTRAYIEAHAGDEQAFALWALFPDLHHPFDCLEPSSPAHLAENVYISHMHQRDLDRRSWWQEQSLTREPAAKTEAQRIQCKEYSRILPQSDAQLAEMTANYYNMITFIDHGLGRILDALQQAGLAGRTVVVFITDHGELLGDHGLYL